MPNHLRAPSPDDAPEPRANVLLVDDCPAGLRALEEMLADLGHNLVMAGSGEEALRRLHEQDFAVVLLDVRAGGQGGFETARRIRSHDRAPHTPVIFLTANGDGRLSAEQAYALGAVDYLIKPLVPVILRAKVAGFVELFRKAEQVKRQAERLRQVERREFERKLAEEDARFRALTEHSSDAVTLVGADGTVLYSSPSSQRVLGYAADEFLGRSGFEIVHPEDLERVRDRLGELARAAGAPVTAELRVRHKDGSWRWVECVGTNLLAEPAVRAVVVNFRDITSRHEATDALRESEQRFARFMQHLPGLAWIKDLEGRYVFANDAAMRAFGRPRADLYGKTDEEVFPPETAAQFRENDRRALAGGAGVQVIEALEHSDGTRHHSLVSKFPILGPDGQPSLVGGMAIDVTERIQMEAALRDADRRKDEFLAMLAHELRNPLAPIRNAVHIMKLVGPVEPNLQRSREMIERQSLHLARLVDDLLDVSRITRGKIALHREPVELASVIARAVETSRPLIDARRHELTVTLPPESVRVEADVTRLAQVVGNLLNNAAKYTEEGGRIGLTVEAAPAQAVLRVRDSGVGIPADLLPRVFDLFTQGDRSLARSEGGLGIGLTLVRSLVEMHGGSVEARSEGPGKGSEFVVRLPALRVSPARTETADGPSRCQARARRVLVVDDSPDAADSLALWLKIEGHEVRTAPDGPTALEAAAAFRPEVIFLDIGLPRMDGYEVARRLRGQLGLRDATLIAVTGYGQEEDRRRAEEAGFDAHLVKPADPEALERLLAAPGGAV
jgi:PAS domain S-box-containing protein